MRWRHLLILVIFSAAASAEERESDTARDVGRGLGGVVSETLRHVPIINTLIQSVDRGRNSASDRLQRRRDRREAEEIRAKQWQLCVANPCQYREFCAENFSREFVSPSTCAVVAQPPAPSDSSAAAAQDIRDAEGLRLTPYPDSTGVIHVGYGHRLQIEPAQAEALLQSDLEKAHQVAARIVGETWSALDPGRQAALAEMAYILGPGLANFTNFLAAVREADWTAAVAEVLDSRWARQAPHRASRVAAKILNGGDEQGQT